MTDFLLKRFVKEYHATEKPEVRTAYGTLSGAVGIICNLVLFLLKFSVGLILNSIAVTADAFNNLSDAASSVISYVGIKMAGKPADEEHPFGHGRMEYLAAFIIAFIVMEVGFSFLKDAMEKIKNPEMLSFQVIPLLLLLASILIKIWLGLFNKHLSKCVDSKIMKAAAMDSMGDVAITSVTILSILICHFFGYNIDGYMGVLVAAIVMYAGFCIAKDAITPLIGEAVDPALYRRIKTFVESYDGILGTHDLIVHNYGPSNSMATIHAEVANNVDIEQSHELIDRIEQDVRKQLGIFIVIHMDPLAVNDEILVQAREQIGVIIEACDDKVSIHDFRMVKGKKRTNLIFDMVVPHSYDQSKRDKLKQTVCESIHNLDPMYQCVITVEKSYVAIDAEGKSRESK